MSKTKTIAALELDDRINLAVRLVLEEAAQICQMANLDPMHVDDVLEEARSLNAKIIYEAGLAGGSA
ncbi:MAG: hypothetical protein KGL39_48655 [Patescibacteria group bacterium]|nr:hypothetical protein [Patescibacteria group bacterium]